MSEKDIALKHYLSDNERFADLINGIAFEGEPAIQVEELEEKDTLSVYHKRNHISSRERDIIKKVVHGSQSLYIACENQMEIHYGMPVRTILYNGFTYNEQLREFKRLHNKKKDLKNTSEFLSGITKTDKLMAVITFICYYGREEWKSPLALKDMIQIPKKYHKLEAYLTDHPLNLVPMMKINPNVFHSDLRELIALLQCNSDIQKIEELVQSNDRYRFLSEETFEVFMILSDEKAALKKVKEHFNVNRKGQVTYDMCRAFEQLEARGREAGFQQGLQLINQMNELYSFLIAEKRYDDLEKAITDENFRQELYHEIQTASMI